MRWLLVLVCLAAASACDGEGSADPSATEATAPTPEQTGDGTTCPNLHRAERNGGTIEADIDGDTEPDAVSVTADTGGPPGCMAFVVVDTGSERLVAPIADEMIAFDLGLPLINSATDIDGRPGAEVVVDIWSGASTAFVGAFGAGGGNLRRITVGPLGDLFPYGGSVGHLEATDCVEGRVVVSTAEPVGARYLVRRMFFVPEDRALVLDATERERVGLRRLQDFPEFAGGAPFASCD